MTPVADRSAEHSAHIDDEGRRHADHETYESKAQAAQDGGRRSRRGEDAESNAYRAAQRGHRDQPTIVLLFDAMPLLLTRIQHVRPGRLG